MVLLCGSKLAILDFMKHKMVVTYNNGDSANYEHTVMDRASRNAWIQGSLWQTVASHGYGSLFKWASKRAGMTKLNGVASDCWRSGKNSR